MKPPVSFKCLRIIISFILIITFVFSSLYIPNAQAGEMVIPRLPAPGIMVHLSPAFTPAHLQGLTIHPENALRFDFLIHQGDGQLDNGQKKEEYGKLVKYFLASLTVPDEDQWVNLSPYEHDRVIKDDFGKTEMGRDLLSQDYFLKQITSSLMYPESGLGKEFWDKVYARAYKEFGTSNIPVNTFNKVWIIPDQAAVYESGNTVYILRNHLKVMLEEDYLSLEKHSGIETGIGNPSTKAHTIASKVVKEIILPELEREVNEGKNFAMLRQIYSGMILATWYKHALKETLLGKVYANQSKVSGVDQKDPKANAAIYQRYLRAFKKGVFNFIKEDADKYSQQVIPRKYFAGGIHDFAGVSHDVKAGFKDAAVLVVNREDFALLSSQVRNKIGSVASADDQTDQADVDLEPKDSNSAMMSGVLPSWVKAVALAVGLTAVAPTNLFGQQQANIVAPAQKLDPKAQALIDIVKDPVKNDFEAREKAIIALRADFLLSRPVVDLFLDTMLNEPDKRLSNDVFLGLLVYSDNRIIALDIDRLLSALDKERLDPIVREHICGILGLFPSDEKVADRLIELLEDSNENPSLRDKIADQLAGFKVRRQEINAVFISMLNGNFAERKIAARVLGTFNEIVTNINVLADHLNTEKDADVIKILLESLAKYAAFPQAADAIVQLYQQHVDWGFRRDLLNHSLNFKKNEKFIKFLTGLLSDENLDLDFRTELIVSLNFFPEDQNIKKALVNEWKNQKDTFIHTHVFRGLKNYIDDDDVWGIFIGVLTDPAYQNTDFPGEAITAFVHSKRKYNKVSATSELLIKKLQEFAGHKDPYVRKNVISIASDFMYLYPDAVLKIYIDAISEGKTEEAETAFQFLISHLMNSNPDTPTQFADLLFTPEARKVLEGPNVADILKKALADLNDKETNYMQKRAVIQCFLASLGDTQAVTGLLRGTFQVGGFRIQEIENILRLTASYKKKESVNKNEAFFKFLFKIYQDLKDGGHLDEEDGQIWKLLQRSQKLNIDIPFRFDMKTLDVLLTERENTTKDYFQDYVLVLGPKADWNGAFYNTGYISDAIARGKKILYFEWGKKEDMEIAAKYIRDVRGGRIGTIVFNGHSEATTTYFGVGDTPRGRISIGEPHSEEGTLTVSKSDGLKVQKAFEGLLAPDVLVVVVGCSTGQPTFTESVLRKKFGKNGSKILKWLWANDFIDKISHTQYQAHVFAGEEQARQMKRLQKAFKKQYKDIVNILQGAESVNIVNFLRDNIQILAPHVKVLGPQAPLGMDFTLVDDDNGKVIDIKRIHKEKDGDDEIYRTRAFNDILRNNRIPVDIRRWLLPGSDGELGLMAYNKIGDFDGFSLVRIPQLPVRRNINTSTDSAMKGTANQAMVTLEILTTPVISMPVIGRARKLLPGQSNRLPDSFELKGSTRRDWLKGIVVTAVAVGLSSGRPVQAQTQEESPELAARAKDLVKNYLKDVLDNNVELNLDNIYQNWVEKLKGKEKYKDMVDNIPLMNAFVKRYFSAMDYAIKKSGDDGGNSFVNLELAAMQLMDTEERRELFLKHSLPRYISNLVTIRRRGDFNRLNGQIKEELKKLADEADPDLTFSLIALIDKANTLIESQSRPEAMSLEFSKARDALNNYLQGKGYHLDISLNVNLGDRRNHLYIKSYHIQEYRKALIDGEVVSVGLLKSVDNILSTSVEGHTTQEGLPFVFLDALELNTKKILDDLKKRPTGNDPLADAILALRQKEFRGLNHDEIMEKLIIQSVHHEARHHHDRVTKRVLNDREREARAFAQELATGGSVYDTLATWAEFFGKGDIYDGAARDIFGELFSRIKRNPVLFNQSEFKNLRSAYSVSDILRGLIKLDGNAFSRLAGDYLSENDKALLAIDKTKITRQVDAAMKGGIDLNSANLNLQIKRDGRGVPLPLLQQDWASLSLIKGFVPNILEIRPVGSLPIISELQQELQQTAAS